MNYCILTDDTKNIKNIMKNVKIQAISISEIRNKYYYSSAETVI